MKTIRGAVGKGGSNHPEDVRTVQALLNQNIGKLAPLRSVSVSGNCDSQTIMMIEEFQRRVMLVLTPDGRVDPGKGTIAALNGVSSSNSAAEGAAISKQLPSAAKALIALSPFVSQRSHDALRHAITAYFNYAAAHPNSIKKPYLYFVDYGLNNKTRRGYVLDMVQLTLVEGPFTVAHGTGSGPRNAVPTRFENLSNAHTTSLGLYLTEGTRKHHGHYGGKTYEATSLVLDGKSKEFNNAAKHRLVVIHGAPYVEKDDAGRSQGCPAMEMDRAKRLIPLLTGGAVVFLFSPKDSNWLANDPWMNPLPT